MSSHSTVTCAVLPSQAYAFVRKARADAGISDAEFRGLSAVIDCTDWNTGRCSPTLAGLARKAGMKRNRLSAAITKLVARGLVLRRSRKTLGLPSSYIVAWDFDGWSACDDGGADAPAVVATAPVVDGAPAEPVDVSENTAAAVVPVDAPSRPVPAVAARATVMRAVRDRRELHWRYLKLAPAAQAALEADAVAAELVDPGSGVDLVAAAFGLVTSV